MTDFKRLYQKFQFNENEAKQLKDLHLLSKDFQENQKVFTIKTIVSDRENETIIKSEVKNGKLV